MSKRRLPVFRVVGRSLAGVARFAPRLFLLALAPGAISVALDYLRDELLEPQDIFSVQAGLFSIVAALPAAVFAYSCHRICLAQAESLPPPAGQHARFFRFLAWTLAGVAMYAAVSFFTPLRYTEEMQPVFDFDPIGSLFYYALLIVTLIITIRTSVMLPIAVTRDSSDPRQAWELTRGRAWRLLWATSLPALFVLPAIYGLQWFGLLSEFARPLDALPGGGTLVATAALVFSQYVGVALAAFALSHAYLFLREPPAGA